jgi:HSP20 family molecular chaperone IbpA
MTDANAPRRAARRRDRPARRTGAPEGASCRIPPATVTERDDEVAVTVDLPECGPTDADILLSGDLLYVEARGNARDDGAAVGEGPLIAARTVALPTTVDAAGAVASLDGGVLTVTLPTGRTDPAADSTWIATP